MQGKRLKVANRPGEEVIVDEEVEVGGLVVFVDGQYHVLDEQGSMRTVLAAMGLGGWSPKNGDWKDLRQENLERRGGRRKRAEAKGYWYNRDRGKWLAWGMVDGKRRVLGSFETEEQAREARRAWEQSIAT